MIIRSKAPLRLGLGGGGSDVSPYCDKFGGLVLNVTIELFTHCTIIPRDDGMIQISATDRKEYFSSSVTELLEIDGLLPLHKAVYNRIIRDHGYNGLSFEMTTYCEAPAGSGLGTSSTLVVCIIKAFCEWLNLNLSDYEIATLAFDIERNELKFSGGKQDQYAATFGGFNFIEFYDNNKVIVNQLRVKEDVVNELQSSLILFFTGVSRLSSNIIDHQIDSLNDSTKLEAMHQVKNDAIEIKNALLTGDYELFHKTMNHAWNAKKRTSSFVSSSMIDEIYTEAMNSGALSGKISGAGGGGFMFFFVDPAIKNEVIEKLSKYNGYVRCVSFTLRGAVSWKV